MYCLGSFRFPHLGVSMILCAAVFSLFWPAADAATNETSRPVKRGTVATRSQAQATAAPAKARRADAANRSRARGGATQPGKASRRAGDIVSPKGVAVARTSKRSTVALAQARPADPPKRSLGHAIGLHAVNDPLSLQSAVALVLDQGTGQVLLEKNAQAVLPIASISKLMTAMVVLDAQLPMPEMLEISDADVDTERNTRSRLGTGTRLSRGELLQLALMSSENRAAHALGRNYPGGMASFVAQMNRKAREIGMSSSHFVEPTGLSSQNVSNARDLATLVRTASNYPLIREYSTASALTVDTGYRTVSYRNTNRLIGKADWDIGLQKTGYISEAGNCVVMQTRIEGRPMVLVLLDAQARTARFGDAQRIRSWLERAPRTVIDGGAGAHRVSAKRIVQASLDS